MQDQYLFIYLLEVIYYLILYHILIVKNYFKPLMSDSRQYCAVHKCLSSYYTFLSTKFKAIAWSVQYFYLYIYLFIVVIFS